MAPWFASGRPDCLDFRLPKEPEEAEVARQRGKFGKNKPGRVAERGGLRSRAGCEAGRATEQGGLRSRASYGAGSDGATTCGAEVGGG
jgi:hypothetical protein